MAGNRYDSGQGADPRQGWSAPNGQPEYFTAPQRELYQGDTVPDQPSDPYRSTGYDPRASYAAPPGDPQSGAHGDPYADPHADPYADPYAADRPGHTRAFPAAGSASYGDPQDDYGQGYQAQDNVAVYRAGGQAAPHTGGPRLPWRQLLAGIYRRPSQTFDRMREHQCWLPALSVSLLYGVLAVLAMGSTHNQIVNSTFSVAAWAIGGVAVAFTLAGGMLGAVTYALARQFGGDGPWQSTVGLAVLIGWTTDAPRLLLALFLPSGSAAVQALGWATWLLCAALLTIMVRRIHDLPWGKAAGAAAVQLLALLVLIKLPTLG